jgi:nucleotide-binding universal stress UspA family protein
MTKILVPVDGSEPALRAVDHAIARARAGGAEILLLNVQPALPLAVAEAAGGAAVQSFHRDEAAKILKPAEAKLKKAGIAFTAHNRVGTPGEAIVEACKEAQCDEIVMGVRGLGAVLSLLLGSTTTKVLALATVPVTLIK